MTQRVRFRRVPGARFERAVRRAGDYLRHGRLVAETITTYSTAEYQAMATYLSEDGQTGYAVKADGDLVSVFNVGAPHRGDALVRSAIRHGATKLDAFDEAGFLPALYARHGFREVGRVAWDDQYAPAVWSGGRPDVVFMELQA